MIDSLTRWISKGELCEFNPEELAQHTRYTHYFAVAIALCLALLVVQYTEVSKQDLK